jgi:uncharacterized protein YjiS (DUF1127 family)
MQYTRKSKLTIKRNQAPKGIALFGPGVDRRVAVIADRGDTDNLVPGTNITMDELHQYQLLGRRLQARATASALGDLFRAVVSPVKKLAAAYGRVLREATAIRQLGALDDHLLRDIGIRRENIPAAVAGLMNRPAVAHAAPVVLPPAGQQAACNDPHAKAAA